MKKDLYGSKLMTRTSAYYDEVVHIGGTTLRLHSFLELFNENIIVKIYNEEGILTETCIGDVPQRVLNFRFVDKCELDNDKLVIYTTVKTQEELDFMEE